MSKTFTEVMEMKATEFFSEFGTRPHIIGYITKSIPIAIAAYLTDKLSESENAESELVISSNEGPICKFLLKAVKKGDSVAFIPDFELLEVGKKWVMADELNFDSMVFEEVGRKVAENKDFINSLNSSYAGLVYVNGEWKSNPNTSPLLDNEANGVMFSEEADSGVIFAVYILTIFEILCNNKDASNDVELPSLLSLGKVKISPVKDGWNVSIVFDKEFKAACKSDALAEKIASL